MCEQLWKKFAIGFKWSSGYDDIDKDIEILQRYISGHYRRHFFFHRRKTGS